MASEIRVNSLSSRTGLSTVTFTDTGPIFSGITTFQDNSGFNVGTGGSIFSPASNAVTLGTNNAERLRISSTGQIGMGKAGAVTVNGNSPLTIQESDSNSETICLRATNSGGNGSQPGIVMKTAAGGHIGGIYCDVNSDYMRLSTSGTDRLTITDAGNIGVGVASPSQKFMVKGIIASEATNSTNNWMAYTHTDNTFRLNYNGAGNDEVIVTSGGNVSVGGAAGRDFSLLDGIVTNTANGSAGLLINSSSSSHNAYLGFSYGSGSGTSHADQFSAYIGRVGDNTLILGTDNNIRVRITSAGTLESYSPDDTTPNIKWRSNDTNWYGSLNQSVEGGTITSFLSCGGDWSANGTTYSATKALAAYPTSAIAVHNQYNSTWGSEFVFLTKAGGSSTTDGAVTERLRIDSSGRLLVGHNSNATPYVAGKVQLSATDSSAALSIARYQNSSSNPYLALVKSRGGLGAATIVQDNDGLGYITFVGADGNDLTSEGAAIAAEVDGTPGQDDMPGALIFKTTSDGSNSASERLRITSEGETLLSNNVNRFLSLDRTNASSGSGEFNVNVEVNSQASIIFDDGAPMVIGTASSPRTQAGFSEKVRISSEGYVTKGNHPSFRVGRSTDYNHTGLQPVQFNYTSGSAHLNRGNHYNTSTHRFVAPVAGVYQFSACIIVNNIANNTDLTDLFYLYKNGGNVAYSMRRARYVSGYTGTNGYFVDFMSNVNVLMAANDYCDIRVRLSLSVHGNASYTWFSGTLVG